MNHLFRKIFLNVLPKRTLTTWVGWLASHPVSRVFIPWYIRHYQIDVADCEREVTAYPSLLEFFSRRLRPGARHISTTGVVSPVDGTVSQFGDIVDGMLLQAKGSTYTLAALLGSKEDALRFRHGRYITLYLSPRDYHRIHMPLSGMIRSWRFIPGTLYPVNQHGVAGVPGLFTKNERLITEIVTQKGLVMMVKVGATIVGSIRTTYGPSPQNAWRRRGRMVQTGAAEHRLDTGDEIGHFAFGSTVILVFEEGMILPFQVQLGQSVRMGERIAEFM